MNFENINYGNNYSAILLISIYVVYALFTNLLCNL
jgi:hypothetical protein